MASEKQQKRQLGKQRVNTTPNIYIVKLRDDKIFSWALKVYKLNLVEDSLVEDVNIFEKID